MFSYVSSFFRYENKEEKSVTTMIKEDYTGSASQRNFIQQKIEAYQAASNSLKSSYKTVSAMGGTVLLLSCGGLLPAVLLMGGYCALEGFKNPADIKAQSGEYQARLKELLMIYQWMTKKGAQATNDMLVIDILKLIAPYIVQTDDLIPDSFIRHAKEINPLFFGALEKTPHELSTKMFQLIYDERKTLKKEEESKNIITQYMPRVFKSNACRRVQEGSSQLLFGYDSSLEKMPEAKLRKVI